MKFQWPLHVIFFILFTTQIKLSSSNYEKGSLVYVIDSTLSMTDDIDQVKRNTDEITEIVFQRKESLIQNMVLVTFNDPDANLENVTDDKNIFRTKINAVEVHNYDNRDCEEMSMNGILIALENCLPRSFIYVFTDASAKDYKKGDQVKKLCQQKQSQIQLKHIIMNNLVDHMPCFGNPFMSHCWARVSSLLSREMRGFMPQSRHAGLITYINPASDMSLEFLLGHITFILTGDCWDFSEPIFQVYYDIAAACPGLAIYIEKADVHVIFEAIKDSIKDNKEMITSRTIPAKKTVGIPFEITEDIEYATVSASGSEVTLGISSEPAHNEQRLSWINNLKVVRLTNVSPGTYIATVYSTSLTTINIFGRSDFSFEVGFSGLEPKTLKETISHPIENISTQIFISVRDANHTVNIMHLQILDIHEHVIPTYDLPLKKISKDFYSTPSFIPPSTIFKVAVCGKAVNTGKKIKRLGRFPITPQKPDKYLAPKIYGEASKSGLKGTSTNIKCTITEGTPSPQMSWQFMANGNFEFVPIAGSANELLISKIGENDGGSYKCVASNIVGKAEHVTVFTVKDPPVITSISSFVYKSIQGQDKELRIPCKSTGLPKPIITWSVNHKTILTSVKYVIEDENLVIKDPKVEDTNIYVCTAANDVGTVTASFQVDIIHIPVITSDFSSIYKGVEGQDKILRIPCRATGIPRPMITWTRNKDTIRTSAKYYFDNGDLIIKNPSIDDTSIYVCTAHNDAGSVTASFQAEVLHMPVITSDYSTVYKAIEGKDKILRLPCKAAGQPKPTITWALKQDTVSPSTKYVYEDGDLIIMNPITDDTSEYTCTAKNEAGSVSALVKANILRFPVIRSDSSTVYYSIEGQDKILRLPCKATGIPKPVITWTRNKEIIKPRAKHNLVDGDLLIKDPTIEDTSTYVCTAVNEAGSVSASFQTEIHQKPQVSGENTKTVRVSSSVGIKCLITKGVPMPKITWQFKAKAKSDYVRLLSTDNVLRISSVAEKDDGLYQCVANNIAGQAEHTTTLIVQVPPVITSDSSKPYTAVEGRETVLKIPCATTGFPRPTIKWIKTNGPIKANDKYGFEDEKLIIKNPTIKDSATYFCLAKNDAGYISASFHVEIYQLPEIYGETSKLVELGSPTDIKCRIIKGFPAPTINWFKAKIGSRFVHITGSDSTLHIPSVKEEDAGRYKCIARNIVDEAIFITKLVIKSAPKILTIHPEPYEGLEGDVALSLPCNAIGIPTPQISWSLNGNNIKTNSHYLITRGALIIKDPKMSDTGSYTCEATNSVATVHAVYYANIKKDLSDYGDIEIIKINILKPSVKKLNCGSPGQLVRWFVDHEEINTKGNTLPLSDIDYDGNFTCRVSDMHEAYTKTYRVIFGEPPMFQFQQEQPAFEWTGYDNDMMDCSVDSENDTRVDWTYNGELLSDHTSFSLGVGAKWGLYTCNVSNDFGAIQRSFDVFSSQCFIPFNPKEYKSMPLILNERLSWPTLLYTENYFALNPGDKIIIVCSKNGNVKNNFKALPTLNEITAICEKQDIFTVNREPFKASDLGCTHDLLPTVIKEHKQCHPGSTESIQVGFNVPNFLETFKVCFDKAINMPRYASVIMPYGNENNDLHYKWYRHPEINFRTDNRMYTCKNFKSICCYSKTQLITPREVFRGPAQSTTFIETINAVPLWHPCDKERSPWKDVMDKLSEHLLISPAEIIWAGIHTLEYYNGHLVPRYLFKLVKFINEDPIAIIYVNGPSPTSADILCKNICSSIFWVENEDIEIYCCHGDEFRTVFSFNY